MPKHIKFLAEGRNRLAYLSPSGRRVIKFPLNGYGEIDNHREAIDYANNWFLGRDKLARCRLATLNGNQCLVMEFVEPVSLLLEDLPEWTGFVDCRQVGLNKNGKLVAYDWA